MLFFYLFIKKNKGKNQYYKTSEPKNIVNK